MSTPNREFRYPVKSDVLSNTRLYIYNIYEHVFNGKVGAPVQEKLQNGSKVLEICCDDGNWITEVAAEYPNTRFYAIDSTLPNSSRNIDNVTFVECDIFNRLPFSDNEFDYVSSKDKFIMMGKDAFRKVLSEVFRVLKPGGWLEVVYTFNPDTGHGSACTRLINAWESWLREQNVDYDIKTNFKKYLQETEKVEYISYRIVETPFRNDYAFGEFILEVYLSFYRSARDCLAPFMRLSFEEFDKLMNNVESELNSKDNKLTLKHKQILARKKSTRFKENRNYTSISNTK